MAELALILGNGFDLDMGLPSRYSDFAESNEFKAIVKKVSDIYNEKERAKSLILQLKRAYMVSNWFDIEEEIHKYVISNTTLDNQMLGFIRSEFNDLKKALYDYLLRITTNFTANKEKLSASLIYHLEECPLTALEIYFNYTSPSGFLRLPLRPEIFKGVQHWFTFVHGSLRNNDIVLGCDLQEEKVNRQLSFLYKYNMLNKANHVARNLLEAKEIIFFGHSINEMDFGYFREFFKEASTAPDPIRHLTIITYDEESERTIKDNIRNQGISVTDLYNNLWTFDFIHTKNVYDGNEEEIKKWNGMIARVLAKDRHGV